MTTDREQNLRTEYLRISEQIAAAGARTWQAAAFLVGGAFAAAGLVVTRGQHGRDPFIQALILGVGIIVALLIFKFWHLRREDWRTDILYKREEEIEEELELYAGRYVLWLDHKKQKGRLSANIPNDKKKHMKKLNKDLPSPGPVARKFAGWITFTGIGVWLCIIISEFSLWLIYDC